MRTGKSGTGCPTSVLRRDLRDRPTGLLDDGVPWRIAAAAALLAGEPQRAFAVLKQADPAARSSPEWAALHNLAYWLEVNWWPGDTGSRVTEGTRLPDERTMEIQRTGDEQRDLRIDIVSKVQFELTSTRSIVRSMARLYGARSAAAAWSQLNGIRGRMKSAARIDASAAAFLTVELAELCRLWGLNPMATTYLARARLAYAAQADSLGLARCLLVEADRLVAPTTFTETLGFDLEFLDVARPAPTAAQADRARRLYLEARKRYRAVLSMRGVCASYLGEGCLDFLIGRAEQAENRLREAHQLARRAGDGATAHLALINAALAAVAAGRLSAAMPGPGAEIERWAKTVGSSSYGRGLAQLVLAAGHTWRIAGDLEPARVTLTLALDLAFRLAGPAEQRDAMTELGYLFREINSMGPALANYQRALSARLEQFGGPGGSGPVEPRTWLEIVQLIASMLDLHASERDPDDLARTTALAASVLARGPIEGSAPATAFDILGVDGNERIQAAQWQAERAKAVPGESAFRDNDARSFALARTVLANAIARTRVLEPLYRAYRCQREGDDATAADLFETALAEATALGDAGRSLLIIVLSAVGRRGEAQAVLRELTRDAPAADPDMVIPLCAQAGAHDEVVRLVRSLPLQADPGWRDLTRWGTALATASTAPDDLALASGLLDRARAGFETRLAGASRDAFRVSIIDDGNARELYTIFASLHRREGRLEEAFGLTDRLRSLSLNGLLDDVAERVAGEPERSTALLRWSQASAEWTGAYDLLAAAGREGDVDGVSSAQASLDQRQLRLEGAERELETAAPGRLLRGRRLTPPVRLQQVQGLIPKDAVLVEYLVGQDRILIWAIDRHGVAVHEIPFDISRLSGLARRFHGSCARRRPLGVEQDLATLTGLLLDPVADRIREQRRVIVVPSGPLHLIPFHALPFDGDALGAAHTLSVLPAASVLPHVTGRSRPALERGALVVGDPAYAPQRALPRLPGSRVEATQVAARFGTTALLDDSATARNVAMGAERAAVIHLATHGLVSDVAPTTSSVALAGLDELTVADLMGLAIDADLVVLSACDTGRGEVTSGGDVVGLARGLLAAGARNAVVSLWPVHDATTCILMERFARRLGQGDTIADALAAAQREVRTMDADVRSAAYLELQQTHWAPPPTAARTTRDLGPAPQRTPDDHPYWWAPFVHIGI